MRKNILGSLVAGAVMLTASVGAQAAFVITLGGNPIAFDSIDWSSGGSAWSPNYDPNALPNTPAATFDLYVMAKAVALNLGANQVYTFGAAEELTVFAHLNETVAAENPASPGGITQDFLVNAGTWSIFRDAANNADQSTGVGFGDGTKILGGMFDPGTSGGSFTIFGTDGSGSQALLGFVDLLPSGAIQPHPGTTVAATTLQLGGRVTGWSPPTGFSNGLPDGGTDPLYDSTTQLVLQADANQAFLAVPEPTSMALLCMGLGVLALRRRQ